MYCCYSRNVLVFVAVCIGVALCQYPICADVHSTGTLNNVVIEGCTPGQTCILKKGTSHKLEFDFTPSSGSNTLEVDVYGIIAGIPIPYPGFDTNGCNSKYNIQCPLSANTQYQYQNDLVVSPSYPSISVTVKVQLKDSSQNTITCFLVNAQIES